MNPPKVFITYSHDSEGHKRRVFELAEKLRSEGIDCNIDQYEMAPVDGWPRWMRNEIKNSDFVIIVCTETYERRYEGTEELGSGVGAKWEGAIITQQLYEAEGKNTKFIPIVFASPDSKHIPLEMRSGTWYRLDNDNGYELLYRRLTGQPPTTKSSLGKLRHLPVAERKRSFTASGQEPLRKLKKAGPMYSPRSIASYVNFKFRYFEHLVYKYRTYRTQGVMTKGPFTLDLEKVFISLRVGAESPINVSPDLLRREERGKDFSIWDFLEELPNRSEHHHHIVVLGGPGSGKTTLLEHLALTYALRLESRRHAKPPKLIPVLIHLRDVKNIIIGDQSPNIVELIEQQEFIQRLGPPAHWFENKIKQKKCLIMLDGLDEVADEIQRKHVSSWVNQQLDNYATPFILTSRPFGYTSAPIENVGVSLEVQPFNIHEVEQFIHNWYLQNEIMSQVRREDPGVREEARKKAADLVMRIKDSAPIAAMAVNPLLLTMIATIHAIRAVLPGKRIELYAEICDVLLGRRQEAKGIPDPLTSIQKRAVLQVLAFALMQRKTREFSLDVGCDLIESILSAVTNKGEIDPKDFIHHVHNVSGLIVEKTIGIYEFAHQSFQEYLAAVQIKATNHEAILVENIHESWWSETIRLYAAQGDATILIRTTLENPSVVALTIASDCLEEAAIIEPEVRRQLERTLQEGIESDDISIARMAAEVKLSLRLNRFLRVNDHVEIDPSHVTRAEYQLFIDDRSNEGLCRQPDHWKAIRFVKGEGDLPVTGLRASYAEDFCQWLNHRYPSDSHWYRLPDLSETNKGSSSIASDLGTWCNEDHKTILTGVTSTDWSTWQNLSFIYACALKHVFDQGLNLAVVLDRARCFSIDNVVGINVYYAGGPLSETARHVLNTLTRYKAQADFLFRELDVNIFNVVPLTRDLADHLGIDANLASDLLERELEGVIDGSSTDLELNQRLELARRLARNVGAVRLFTRELGRDLQDAYEYLSDKGAVRVFNRDSRSPRFNLDQLADRSCLLLHYSSLGNILTNETENKEFTPANIRKLLLGAYLCHVLVKMRKEGQLSAWEGIRIVRESKES